ncbi:hypothetical protein IGI03_05995 [Bacillus thuringiensis]|uniref:hypothetical protein n=1 Tax=Bacillus thuringiensis TaxID=1428 RepID=UPI001876704A|nr:hypothetical protein [Bacillus thuringiensis]MBE5087599.1 hypothetical protein [Bacillus thuringiensis]
MDTRTQGKIAGEALREMLDKVKVDTSKLSQALVESIKTSETHKLVMTKDEINSAISIMKNLTEAQKHNVACELVGVHHHAELLHLIDEYEKEKLALE